MQRQRMTLFNFQSSRHRCEFPQFSDFPAPRTSLFSVGPSQRAQSPQLSTRAGAPARSVPRSEIIAGKAREKGFAAIFPIASSLERSNPRRRGAARRPPSTGNLRRGTFPFDIAVPRVDGVAAELVSVNCNAFWPIRDYTMK